MTVQITTLLSPSWRSGHRLWLFKSPHCSHLRDGRRGADDVEAADGHQHLGERHLPCVVDTQCRRLLTPRQADAELNHGGGGADDDDDERGGRDGGRQDVDVNGVNDGPGREKAKENWTMTNSGK